MNIEDFLKQLSIDPNDRDSEFTIARDASPEHAAAYKASVSFEQKLKTALSLPLGADTTDQFLKNCFTATQDSKDQFDETPSIEGFLKQLSIDPNERDSGFIAARDASPEHAAAYRASASFEQKLKTALSLPLGADTTDQLLKNCFKAKQDSEDHADEMRPIEGFLKQLSIDPNDRNPEFIAARDASPEHAAAYQASVSFEQKLTTALSLPLGADMTGQLLENCFKATQDSENQIDENLSIEDFVYRLNTEPNVTDDDFLTAKRSSIQHAAAYRDAMAFEDKLAVALKTPTNPELSEQILDHCLGPRKRFNAPLWLSAAAGIVIALGIGIFAFQQNFQPGIDQQSLARAEFVEHFDFRDYEPMWPQKNQMSDADIDAVLAQFNVSIEGQMGELTYLKRCRIGEQWGIHMVFTDENGQQVTAMMTAHDNPLPMQHSFQLASASGKMIALGDNGLIALFGHQGQPLEPIEDVLRQQLSFGPEFNQLIASL